MVLYGMSCVVKNPKIISVSWSPLLEDWVKLNTDGTSRGNLSYAGSGGSVLCDG